MVLRCCPEPRSGTRATRCGAGRDPHLADARPQRDGAARGRGRRGAAGAGAFGARRTLDAGAGAIRRGARRGSGPRAVRRADRRFADARYPLARRHDDPRGAHAGRRSALTVVRARRGGRGTARAGVERRAGGVRSGRAGVARGALIGVLLGA
ncbi:hypothetical protein PLANTIT3_50253 [Plantibacter sp. T3]|nr:hypothetical protein PLANTIT3_50253 [Plantibacter sp. T3]